MTTISISTNSPAFINTGFASGGMGNDPMANIGFAQQTAMQNPQLMALRQATMPAFANPNLPGKLQQLGGCMFALGGMMGNPSMQRAGAEIAKQGAVIGGLQGQMAMAGMGGPMPMPMLPMGTGMPTMAPPSNAPAFSAMGGTPMAPGEGAPAMPGFSSCMPPARGELSTSDRAMAMLLGLGAQLPQGSMPGMPTQDSVFSEMALGFARGGAFRAADMGVSQAIRDWKNNH